MLERTLRRLPGALLAAALATLCSAAGAQGAASPFGPLTAQGPIRAAELPPTIDNPGPQRTTVGAAVSLPITGERLASLQAEPLPEGLKLEETALEAWRIAGTATRIESVEVVLSGQNAEKGPAVPQTFAWTVESQPLINPVPNQASTVGVPVSLAVTGERLHTLATAEPLPAGLVLSKVSETEWKIEGTPTTARAAATVVLEAQNAAEGPLVTSSFEWTVHEAPAALNPIPDQTTVVGAPVSLAVTGERIATLTSKGLPAGLELKKITETEWQITGTPTTVMAPVLVTLEAKNSEAAGAARVFKWTIDEPMPTPPIPTGAPTIAPGTVFSAARAECGAVSWSAAVAVATQWLLDDTPIAGATSIAYVPPRADDGHRLSCRQSATAANGLSALVTSPSRTVYEQPPQPVWPIVPAAQRCLTAVCMEDGGSTAVQRAPAYAQEGSWVAARQVRCAAAPWTSQAGDSSLAAIHRLAVAHAISFSLQRVSSAGAVTIASQQLAEVPETTATGGPLTPGSLALGFGGQPFAVGELWTRMVPSALGAPNWFASGAGAVLYDVAATSSVPRSSQLVYNLTPADLGSKLRCVAAAADGPSPTPTRATFASPEYSVATSTACAPRRLGARIAPQPAVVEPGRAPCLLAPAGPAALEGNLAAVAASKGRAVLALACALASSCRGTLSLSSGAVLLGRVAVALPNRRSGLVRIPLDARGRRLLAKSRGSLLASLVLKTHAANRHLGSVRLLSVG